MNGFGELGQVTASLMDTLESAELPDGAEVEEVLVIASVTWPAGEDVCGHSTYYSCSSGRPWVQKGLLIEAGRAISSASRPYTGEEPDDEPSEP